MHDVSGNWPIESNRLNSEYTCIEPRLARSTCTLYAVRLPITNWGNAHVEGTRSSKMVEFTEGEGLFNLRATFEGQAPRGEHIYAFWTAPGAPIVAAHGLASNTTKRTASDILTLAWTLSKYGNMWFITKPGEDKTKGFHYDTAEAGSKITLGYPSPFFLDLCAGGTGGIFRPVNDVNGVPCRSNYCVGISEKGTVEIVDVSVSAGSQPKPTPAWQTHMVLETWGF
ncbi:hypothetical protein B0J17DRAFT_628352 [Rhizoctonia solani]|nr:hypothetical protein B0J17DRAFT_628352 [Rhizoctonia solani]